MVLFQSVQTGSGNAVEQACLTDITLWPAGDAKGAAKDAKVGGFRIVSCLRPENVTACRCIFLLMGPGLNASFLTCRAM